MPDLKLIKNPGYVYDLVFLFHYKYNVDRLPEIWDADEEDMAYFAEQSKLFGPISDDLYLFFREPPSKRCFFTANYFHNYAKVLTTEYDLPFILKEIGDHGSFIKNVIKYYFDELDEDEVNECVGSNKYVFDIIKKSDYDDKLKSRLYEFFVDPESYIRLLQYELMAKDVQLSSYYEKNYSRILDVYNGLSCELLEEQFAGIEHDLGDKTCRSNVYISFCLLNKGLLQFRYSPHSYLYLLGIDYPDAIERVKKKRIDLAPERFGAALSDPNRVRMLEVILQKGKCTCKEIEKALGIPASTTYHHLSTLEKSGVVQVRSRGKALYYSITRKRFAALIEYLKKFAEPEEKQK